MGLGQKRAPIMCCSVQRGISAVILTGTENACCRTVNHFLAIMTVFECARKKLVTMVQHLSEL